MAGLGMLWLVVIFCGLLLLIVIFGVFYFVIRRQTIIRIFMPNRAIYTKRFFKHEVPKVVDLGKEIGTYIIDEMTFYKTFFGHVYHFTFNNPNPILDINGLTITKHVCKKCNNIDTEYIKAGKSIDIKVTDNIPKTIGYRAQDLTIVHDNKLLNDLFSVENLDRIIMFLTILAIILISLDILLSLIRKQPPVILSQGGNNTEYLKSVFKDVIISGGR